MGNSQDAYYRAWLDNEINEARKRAEREWKALDAQAAAKQMSQHGWRIKNSIDIISAAVIPLAEAVYREACRLQPVRERFETGRSQIRALLEELTLKIPKVVRSASKEPFQRTLEAAEQRVQTIRDEFETRSTLELLRIEAEEEAGAVNAKNSSDQVVAQSLERRSSGSRDRTSPKLRLAIQALEGTFPGGTPPEDIDAKERNKKVVQWCKGNGGRIPPSPSTILRAMQIIRQRQKS